MPPQKWKKKGKLLIAISVKLMGDIHRIQRDKWICQYQVEELIKRNFREMQNASKDNEEWLTYWLCLKTQTRITILAKKTNKQTKKNQLNIFLLYLSFQRGLLLFLSFHESKAKAGIYFYNGNQWKIQCIHPLTAWPYLTVPHRQKSRK